MSSDMCNGLIPSNMMFAVNARIILNCIRVISFWSTGSGVLLYVEKSGADSMDRHLDGVNHSEFSPEYSMLSSVEPD